MDQVTAAIVIIGDEILSGRTQDTNTSWIATELNSRGIQLKEVRVVSDETDKIIEAVDALRPQYTYVFTTGGIGPTHHDKTAQAIADAFKTPLEMHDQAKKVLEDYYPPEKRNDARMKMAMIPVGATLIDNPISAAPGFCVENVYVMAGVPAIMKAMFNGFADGLAGGYSVHSRSHLFTCGEGDLAAPLADLQDRFSDVEIGSYPGDMDSQRHQVTVVLRHKDTDRLDEAYEALIKITI